MHLDSHETYTKCSLLQTDSLFAIKHAPCQPGNLHKMLSFVRDEDDDEDDDDDDDDDNDDYNDDDADDND